MTDEQREPGEVEYRSTRNTCYVILQMTRNLEIDACIALAKKSQTLAPLFEPTLFMRNHQALREDIEVMEAVRNLQKVAEKAWGVL